MDIVTAMRDKNLFRPLFRDLSTWGSWIVALKAIFGLEMNNDELALFKQCTGRETPPQKPFKEVFLICGRRSGKTFIAALISAFLAVFQDHSKYLSMGERGSIVIIGVDKRQCQIIFRYLRTIFSLPILKDLVEREVFETLQLTNKINIEVHSASYRSLRGLTVVGAVFEESGFWRSEGPNVDTEIYVAVKPGMSTIDNAMLISISTPYMKEGLLYQNFKDYYATEDPDTLIWRAGSLIMNPCLSERMIEKERLKDPSAASSEWDAFFRQDLETFLSSDVIESVIILGRTALPYLDSFSYFAFADPAGGGGDAFSLSIGHRENGKIVQDLLLGRRGNPSEIVKEYCDTLKQYKIRQVQGDRYAGQWVVEAFGREGITYRHSELSKSQVYLEALPCFSSRSVELLDNQDLKRELRLLERRRGHSGRDVIDHGIGGNDDLANACSGMIAMGHSTVGGGESFLNFFKTYLKNQVPSIATGRRCPLTGAIQNSGDTCSVERRKFICDNCPAQNSA